ncbi:MinD/ParA family protein [Candidatus Bathyarchaeota archaeon]|nr:MinD/ParA family protein [Candidatus Bathyarchaeota archaeon]
MKTITFTVSKGGVGKSLITANVGAALAENGNKVILVEGDPNHPLQLILNVELTPKDVMLDEVVKRDLKTEKAVYPTNINNLSLIPSGASLQSYFDIDPMKFAKKITNLEADFVFIDTPFPLGKAAFLSLGICEYFVPILTEDEFVLCVESAIDTIRLGKYYLKCIPIGFILNRIKTDEKFNQNFVKDLEDLLEIQCITKIEEDPKISKSYGGAGTEKAFLAYQRLRQSEFAKKMDEIANHLLRELPKPEKKDVAKFLQEIIK